VSKTPKAVKTQPVERVMRCWNCGHEVSEKARACEHCEANLTEAPSTEEAAAVMQLLAEMPPEVLAELGEEMRVSASALEFANRILVGPCPSCGSERTGDCDADPELNEILAGRCYECGHLWCTECGNALRRECLYCDCWDAAE
jgi:hypothetical protein